MNLRYPLYSHPTTPTPWVQSIQVEVVASEHNLILRYQVFGNCEFMRVPTPGVEGRVDGLWAHTCGEAFVAEVEGSGYREWNFSPSGQWQLYRFCEYRDGRIAPEATNPLIIQKLDANELTLEVHIPYTWLPSGPKLRLGLAMVLEAQDGEIYYWSLRHPPGTPDFHHADTWIGTILLPTQCILIKKYGMDIYNE